MHELGGHPVVLRSEEMQLSRGEALRDTALVLSRHVAAIGLRTGAGRDARGARRAQLGAGDQHAHARAITPARRSPTC